MSSDTHPPTRQLLGLGCGQTGGSAEILLKAALRSAESAGAKVELVRLNELRIPSSKASGENDDAPWLWERLVACDGVIISTPVISRSVPAYLKLVWDRLLGPNADAAIIEKLLTLQRDGKTPEVSFRLDPRVLKPRVAGFISVGGSLTPQWTTLTLPILHTATFSMQIAVVDQIQFGGAGTLRSIVLNDGAIERATQLGRHVAQQLGTPFEQTEYRGEPGLYPLCHLNLVVLRGADVECGTCGARGIMGADLKVRWTDLDASVISMTERRAHATEIQDTAARHRALRAEIDHRAKTFDACKFVVSPRDAALEGTRNA